VLVDVRDPEAALRGITEPCDVFLCVYVFELILALVQIKYDIRAWRTRPRRLSYWFSPGNTTTYPIHDFWELAVRCGFEPRYVELVPEDELDERYAYSVMAKPDDPGAPMSRRCPPRARRP
jgi:hypothetical protein